MSIAVIIPSIGRPHLGKTIQSVMPQLEEEDQLIVEIDWPNTGHFGNYARDLAASRSRTTHLWFLDDDDLAMPGALHMMRRAIEKDPYCAWFFKIHHFGYHTWKEEGLIDMQNQSGQCYLVPKKSGPEWNAKQWPGWSTIPKQTDFQFGQRLHETFGFKWSEAVIADVGVGK